MMGQTLVNLLQSPALDLGTSSNYGNCYPADFMGPLPPGSIYCTSPSGQLLNASGQPAANPPAPAQTDYSWAIYAGLALLGLLVFVKVIR